MAYNWKILGQQCEAFQFQTFIFNIIVFLSLLLVCHMPGSNKTWTKTSIKIPSQNLKIIFIKKKILIELVFVLFCLRKWSFFFLLFNQWMFNFLEILKINGNRSWLMFFLINEISPLFTVHFLFWVEFIL